MRDIALAPGSAAARLLEVSADAALAGRTSIVIAHRLTQAAAADRIVVMENGRVVEQGSHEALLGLHGVYYGLWQAWSSARSESQETFS